MGRTFACSDLHGMLPFFEQICEMLEPDDIVYFLGDAGDRGPEPWKTIKRVAEHPQFIYLKGNHEDMLVRALKEYKYYGRGHDFSLLCHNGGRDTFEQCIEEDEIDKWITYLDRLPVIKTYKREDESEIIMTHAGFTPHREDGVLWIPSSKDLIWDRYHYYEPKWREECGDKTYIVHGHTPIIYLMDDILGEICEPEEEDMDWIPFWYCDDHKCCIDAGAFFTGEFCLLDLDTFEYYHFSTPLKKSF